MNKNIVFACGQGASKAMMTAIEKKVININNCVVVNSTAKDIPEDYVGRTIILSKNPDAGCGKVREAARSMMMDFLENQENAIPSIFGERNPSYAVIMTTSEGASGSGSSVALASYISQVLELPVVIILITGFESDVRGIQNTINYFKDILGETDGTIAVRVVSNKKFLTNENTTFDAEIKANEEIANVLKVLQANDIQDSSHNIDDTDHIKLINNAGFMVTSEYKLAANQKIKSDSEFIKLINNTIIYNSSIDFSPSASRIGVYINLNDNNLMSITNNVFNDIKEKFTKNGNVAEFFVHKQYDPNMPEYIRIIASGMEYPIDELQIICDTYTNKVKEINETNATSNNNKFLNMLNGIDTNGVSDSNEVTSHHVDENKSKSFFSRSKFKTSHASAEVRNVVEHTNTVSTDSSVGVTVDTPVQQNNVNQFRQDKFKATSKNKVKIDETSL